jgi:hypothetical protein
MVLKPGKNFKLSKTTKRMMSFIVDKAQRDSFKRAMIQAQLSSELKISSKDKDKD